MGVIRVPHVDNFTMMANYHLRDKDLSLRAVGLMSKMLSLPDDWDYTVAGLAAICKEGREAVRKVLQELEDAGYLEREKTRGGHGTFAGYDYTLHEAPHLINSPETGDSDAPLPGFLGDGASPVPGKPVPGKPVPGFPPQSSTKEPSTEEPIPPIAPQGASAGKKEKQKRGTVPKREKKAADYEPELFERFWKAYPRHEDKASARREWDRLRPDRTLMKTMSAALERAKRSDEWRRGFAPYACRWLSHRRWEDEPESAADHGPDAPQGVRKDMMRL